MRRLWARVETACGLDPTPIRLHAETAWRMTTRRDPWVNMLRATVAAFSAGIGGADSVAVLPFTTALGLPDAFARRIARNTQHILLQESNLWRVADPAAGAGGFEALTDALCGTAWGLFQDIEREGGMAASLAAGALQGRIAATRAERGRAIAARRQPITGTSAFPDLAEAPVNVLLPSPLWGRDELRPETSRAQISTGAPSFLAAAHQAKRPPTLPQPKSGLPDLGWEKRISGTPEIRGGESRVAPLPSMRDAEPYERLRDASDAQLARTGARPKVFLANLGAPADFAARAAFAKTLFEAGGIEAVASDGSSSPESAAAAFAASGARLACLCSSDSVYERLAAPAVKALREAGARRLYVAADPAALHDPATAGDVAFIFAGCDALALLEAASEATAT
jgi:methylmalonyl-CoA mutase